MARVALVSRNPVMSMAFSASDHSVAEIRPSGLTEWLERGEEEGVDALVLDLGSPQKALQVAGDLRAQNRWVPILLVATDDPAWGAPDITGLPGVELLPLPLDPHRLKVALTAVLRHPRTPPIAMAKIDDGPLLDPVPDLDVALPPALLSENQNQTPLTPPPDLDDLPLPTAAPRKPRSAQLPKHRADKDVGQTRAARVDPDPSPTLLPTAPPIASPEPSPPEPPAELKAGDPVHWLIEESDSYYTLQELATVIVEDAVMRSMADAGALLVPDGALWRVAGGVSLRPLEYRLQLAEDAWIVENIATFGKGILIQDSDIARLDLRGTPLASREHLMAVPVPQVKAILLLSRDRDEPFTEASLSALADLATEAGPLLEGATDLRTLARLLDKHRDVEANPGI